MSNSEASDDLGGMGPTTPVAPKRTRTARDRQPQAGPSSKPASGTGRRKGKDKAPKITPEEEDSSEVEEVVPDEDMEVVETEPPKRRGRPPTSRSTAPSAVNGKQTATGKGKGASTAKKTGKKVASSAAYDTDIQLIEETDVESIMQGINQAVPAPKSRASKVERELERLRRKNEEAEASIAALEAQLDEVLRVRNTEPEKLLISEREQYEAQLQSKDAIIKELNAALARKEPLTNSGQATVLQLLTREAADEEKRLVEKELQRWKTSAQEKSEALKEKDKLERELRSELNLEIERSKTLASKAPRNPGSAQRGRAGLSVLSPDQDPKISEVIRFYEDMTNLLIVNVKPQPAQYLKLEEWAFTCVYTYVDVDGADDTRQSLNFTIRCCYDIAQDESEPITSDKQLVKSCRYVPLELDKEPPDFVERLDYLSTPFTFERGQLMLFLKSIHDKMAEAMGGSQDEEEDDSIIEVD